MVCRIYAKALSNEELAYVDSACGLFNVLRMRDWMRRGRKTSESIGNHVTATAPGCANEANS